MCSTSFENGFVPGVVEYIIIDSETACSFKITACKFNEYNLPAGAIWRLPIGNHLQANVKVSCGSLINKANGFLVQKKQIELEIQVT